MRTRKGIIVGLTDQERMKLEILADRRGFNMSTYIRDRINTDFQALESVLNGQTNINPAYFQASQQGR